MSLRIPSFDHNQLEVCNHFVYIVIASCKTNNLYEYHQFYFDLRIFLYFKFPFNVISGFLNAT